MAIEAGMVFCNGSPVSKASTIVQATDNVEVTGDPLRYVSQGGLKLEKAIRAFGLDFQGKTVLDAGASTGGFTDCALQHGAARVFAVDVGEGQLAAALRAHPKVTVYEKTDVRQLSVAAMGGEAVDAIVADLSFISLTMVLPCFKQLLKEDGFLVVLIKPQFEMERRKALKGGIIKDPALWEQAIFKVETSAKTAGFNCWGIVETDTGSAGRKNKEFLAVLYHASSNSSPME
jgi:23S rRNA (cytidine1920-2'-O)/16S rRNA (cytidine1409-2'-O)-methyltransferase